MKKILNTKGSATYIETTIFVLVTAMFIAFSINLFSIISAKQQLDMCADQLTRQIQLTGEVSPETDALFDSLTSGIKSADNISYSVDTSYFSGKKIQLSTPFKVKVTAKAYLGGFGAIHLFPIELVSSGAGISEEYWK